VGVALLYFDGCPHWRAAELRVREAVRRLGLSEELLTLREVESAEEAERLSFRGSPTVLINGEDPFADPGVSVGLSCRLYRTGGGTEGSPTVDQLTAALRAHAVVGEMEAARQVFRALVESADAAALERRSAGTRWTNEQLLFHMLFGYLVVRALLVLVRGFGRLPAGASRRFAAALNALVTPFNAVNYWGSCIGVRVYNARRMADKCDRVVASLERRFNQEQERQLRRGMHYPTRWDPFFKPYMTLADVYRYPTQHFEFHRRQLSL
jgi:hypothetical protein